jgi:deoxyribonucleoside regulator
MASQSLIIKICHLFYQEGLAKTEIEKRLHISRFRVARLLKKAQETGIVKIEIVEPKHDLSDIERALEKATGLQNVILVKDDGEPTPQLKKKAGQAAADYLVEVIGHHDVLGIGWGTTTYELVHALPESIGTKVTVVQVSGGNTKLETGIDSQALTVQLAQKFGAAPHLLHAPAIVDRPETRRMLLQESSLKDVFRLYKKIRLLVAGIGALLPDRFVGSWANNSTEMGALRRHGAVAELLSYCFDRNGGLCPSLARERTLAIPLQDIKRVPCAIGLAVGSEKAEAALGVIRSGYINTLITDTTTGGAILSHLNNLNNAQTKKEGKNERRKKQ